MNDSAALFFLHAQTSLHPGTGTALGTVDLPIQRERHTGWPTIAGSSLKGVIRDTCRPRDEPTDKESDAYKSWIASEEYQQWLAVFGPETNNADEHAGALSLTDARILAFPVRSLKGVFAWITCPAVLERLHRDAQLADLANGESWGKLPACQTRDEPNGRPVVAENQALVADGTDLRVSEGDTEKLVLEEFDFTRTGDGEAVKAVADWLTDHAVRDDFTKSRLRSHLVVLHDSDFTHFVRHATEVSARIGLDYETKTVKGGALFYQEFLPAETLMYAVVLAQPSRRDGVSMSSREVRDFAASRIRDARILQIGGDETTGKGLCGVRLEPTSETKSSEASK